MNDSISAHFAEIEKRMAVIEEMNAMTSNELSSIAQLVKTLMSKD